MEKATNNKFYSRVKEFIEGLLLIFLILGFGIIIYSNFKENVDIDSLYSFQEFLIIMIKIALGVIEDSFFLFIVIFLSVIICLGIRLILVKSFYPQILSYISIARNKELKPTLLIKKIVMDILSVALLAIVVFYMILCWYDVAVNGGF